MKKILILTIVLTSCAYGPTQEKKSPLNYLNGEHYEQSASILGVPVIERKTKDTIIQGRFEAEDPFAKLPRVVELNLISDGRIISTLHPNRVGTFSFQGNFPSGNYSIKANADQFLGESVVKVDSYNVKDVLIVMHKVQ